MFSSYNVDSGATSLGKRIRPACKCSALFGSVLLFLASCGAVEKVRSVDFNEASAQNSRYRESSVDRNIAWAIVQARFSAPSVAIGGFCGAAWILESSRERVVFVTASHVVQNELFAPTTTGVIRTLVWLSNGDITIPISAANRILANNDVAFLVVPTTAIGTDKPFVVPKLHAARVSQRQAVFNLGYPNRGHEGNHLGIDLQSSAVSFAHGPWRQEGHVLSVDRVTLVAADVTLKEAGAIVLDYASEVGFSGGPLLTEAEGDVIGVMSAVIPNGESAPRNVLAVSVEEIREQRRLSLSAK